jgi:hypothetical protein
LPEQEAAEGPVGADDLLVGEAVLMKSGEEVFDDVRAAERRS